MSKWVVDIHGDIEGDYEMIKKYEEPKTGHWIWNNSLFNSWTCSECGLDNDKETDYCPNCGAKMVEPQERSGKE